MVIMTNEKDGLKTALENVLKLFDIKIEELPKVNDENEENYYSQVVGKTQSKLDELNEKAEELYERTGMSREQLEAYASNPNNFTKEQWDALQRVKEEAERFKRRTREKMSDELLQTSVDAERKKQPGRFGKKKNWIPL